MYDGWFAGWFGGWYSEWFGGGAEVPTPPTVGGGHVPEEGKRQRKQKRLQLEISTVQARQTGRAAVQTEARILIETIQQPASATAALEFERDPVRLPPLKRQAPGEYRPSVGWSTIGEFIPKPKKPVLHPSPKAETRPQRQEARRPKRAAPRRSAEEEAIMRAIEKYL
jgi:hypothetical protein